jgi:hypothetical protein
VFQVSIRIGCATLCFEKSSYVYKARRPSHVALKKRIREIAETRVRYGYLPPSRRRRAYQARRKPTDNSFVEAFSGNVRAEGVDQNWFLSLADAGVKMRHVPP